jgi:hypothetical protein
MKENPKMIPHLAPKERAEIYHVLESVVVLSWKELLESRLGGVVHVEYGTAPEPSLQYLKMWTSTVRGRWELICEYWICATPSRIAAAGLTFSKGYHSPALARMLEDVMRHQEGFPDSLSGKTGVTMVVVPAPSAEDERKAEKFMATAYHRIGLAFNEPRITVIRVGRG